MFPILLRGILRTESLQHRRRAGQRLLRVCPALGAVSNILHESFQKSTEVETLSFPCWHQGTHPAVPSYTEAEGVLIGASCPIMHHALHGHHLPSLLGLTVEVAPLLGWNGRSRVLGKSMGCSGHFLSQEKFP